MISNWKNLIKKYADGRTICNCGCAYYSFCGTGTDGQGVYRTNLPACAHGCSANQIAARDEIAGRVLSDLSQAE